MFTHTLTLAWRVWNLFGFSAKHHVPHPCCVKRKELSPTKKTCLSMPPLPGTLHHPNIQQPECLSSPTMNLRNLQHPCLRAQFFTRSSVPTQPSPLSFWPTNDTSLQDDDAVTDTTTDGQKRNGRDLTVCAERSTLELRPSQLGKLSLLAHASGAVISRWPKPRATDSAVQPCYSAVSSATAARSVTTTSLWPKWLAT